MPRIGFAFATQELITMTAIFASRIDSHLVDTNLEPTGTMSSAPRGGVPLAIGHMTTSS